MKNISIIALYGSEGLPVKHRQSGSGVGKDEVAKILERKYRFTHLKLANTLREQFYTAFNLPQELKGDKVFEGKILNTPVRSYYIGNELFNWNEQQTVNCNMIRFAKALRKNNPIVFIQALAAQLKKITQACKEDSTEPRVCISDLRQFNEYAFFTSLGSCFIEVQCHSPFRERQELDGQLLSLIRQVSDGRIENNGTLSDLETETDRVITKINNQGRFIQPIELVEEVLKGWLNQPPYADQGVPTFL